MSKRIRDLTERANVEGLFEIAVDDSVQTYKITSTQLFSYIQDDLLADVVYDADLTSALASYVTSASLTSTLSSYVTSASLTTTLADYVDKASTQTISGVKTFTGGARVGSTATIFGSTDTLSVTNTFTAAAATNVGGITSDLNITGNTAITSGQYFGMYCRTSRTITTSTTDTSTSPSGGAFFFYRTVVSSGQTYTYTQSQGINSVCIEIPQASGAGSTAITNASALFLRDNSGSNTGTRRTMLRMDAPSGSTYSAYISDNQSYTSDYFIHSTAARPSVFGGAITADGVKLYFKTSAKSADYTVTDTDGFGTILLTTGASDRTITLPTAADNTHRILTLKKVDTGVGKGILDGEGSETVDGVTTFTLVDQDDYVRVQCDGTGWVVIAKGIGSRVVSRVRDETAAGYGSTNTHISRIETNAVNTGNAITRAVSSTNGNSYTINQDGIYSIQYGNISTASAIKFGISRNSNQLTTNIASITNTARLGHLDQAQSSMGECKWDGRLMAGDVIRPHNDAVAQFTSAGVVHFEIQKVGI